MAEAFATEIAKSLLGKLGSFAVQEFRLACGLQDDLARLEERLKAINAVLSDAEKQQSKNERIRLWLHMLRKVFYDAEDVLDEIECETLQRQVVKTKGSTSRKVQHFFTSSNRIAFRLRMGHNIKKIIERLAEISALKSDFNLSEQAIDCSHVLHEETGMNRSFDSFSGLIRRDEDKERIINLLIPPFKVGDAHPRVLPIVGMGGLGKTSLAKSVGDAEIVERHFQLKMEVCVSDDFSLKQVIQKIIKSATGERCADLDEGELQKKLEEILNGRKYLLLLDDVWNEDAKKWLLLKPVLSKGADGSKIIVTTRSQRVAEIMGTVPAYNLSHLGKEDCLLLFCKCAFKEGQMALYPNLIGIGKEIVAKCKQVPLAVINLGTQLYGKIDETEWKSVRDSEKWEEEGDVILPALKISYQRLPTHLKRCFLYCSVFPKDYQFGDCILVQFWMAHGLILQSANPNENLEDVGLRYVRELISRCFFQDYEDCIVIAYFKMHDLIHDLAASLAQNEFSIISSQNHQISESSRHLSVLDSNSFFHQTLNKFSNEFDHVRSIVFADSIAGPTCKTDFEKCLSGFKYLRSLELMDPSEFEVFPERIGALKHLRYLYLVVNTEMKRLPKSIFKLPNLQALVAAGEGLEELPEDVRHMISLRFLLLFTQQKRLPEGGIGCLECLQTLFIVWCENLENLCEDMQGLKSLRKLFIAKCHGLISLPRSIKCLTTLEEFCIIDCEKLDLITIEEEKGKKIQSLSLSLRIVIFEELPATLALPEQLLQGCAESLQTFIIRGCPNIEEMPECISNLNKLQNLEITRCPRLSKRCRRGTGEDWPKIKHIPKIKVDNDYSGEETSD
ncbi:PREDICTED: putative disease resistance protein RGA3 isoform X8 [Populus euphratica]|uniref:Disease resistance protein RGA3 isoform X8 n=1 Tax=Populus euphratica TaxID=75702 RepID=A0AAJ6XAG9_POPEU|nr:PREDICTED: putative disease resistance protein RGA3 isoform X8 [Populus euphratica]XP_011011372.1 PREDICTED: putative disease resistance protein RGA3 isoform X8 [Populus euphratica]